MRFINLRDLVAGDRVRIEGTVKTIERVQRPIDGHHWRVRFLGGESIVVPGIARFTRHIEGS